MGAAPSAHPLVERPHRARAAHRLPCGLDQEMARLAAATLGDPAVMSPPVTRLSDARVETEIGNELLGGGEAVDPADRRRHPDSNDHVDAGAARADEPEAGWPLPPVPPSVPGCPVRPLHCRCTRRRRGPSAPGFPRLDLVLRHLDPSEPAANAVLERHRFGKCPMDIEPNDPHVSLLFRRSGSWRARGNYRSVHSAHPGKPQGRPINGTGSRPMFSDRSARTHVLPLPRIPDDRIIALARSDRQDSKHRLNHAG